MTNGSSQGLFVIVAVVIFGIFVVISYMLFRDKLQTSLASIFTDSTAQAKENIVPYTELNGLMAYDVVLNKTETYNMTLVPTGGSQTGEYPAGLRTTENITVPWGYKMIISFEVYYEGTKNLMASVDYNAFPVGKDKTNSWNQNDNYGTTSSHGTGSNMYNYQELQPNTWNTVEFWYINDNVKNKEKVDLIEGINGYGGYGSTFGIKSSQIDYYGINIYKIKNVKYKVVKV